MELNQLDALGEFLPLRVQPGSNGNILSQSSENKFAAKLHDEKQNTQMQKHTKHMSSKVGTTIPPTEFQLNLDGKKQRHLHKRSKVFVEGKRSMGGTCLIHKSALGFKNSKINKTAEMNANLSASQDFSEAPKSTNPSNYQLKIPV
jgi:hypothetical protein